MLWFDQLYYLCLCVQINMSTNTLLRLIEIVCLVVQTCDCFSYLRNVSVTCILIQFLAYYFSYLRIISVTCVL